MPLFLSDNGNSQLGPLPEDADRLPGKKGDSREGGTRIPLVANWPAKIPPGCRCDDLVHVQDFLPTFVELAGGTVGADRPTDGVSFAPRLLGTAAAPREYYVGWGAHPSVWLDRVARELGKPDLKPYRFIWARGQRFKLYSDGRFYDLENDRAEASRILPGDGSPDAEEMRHKYQQILSQYITGED